MHNLGLFVKSMNNFSLSEMSKLILIVQQMRSLNLLDQIKNQKQDVDGLDLLIKSIEERNRIRKKGKGINLLSLYVQEAFDNSNLDQNIVSKNENHIFKHESPKLKMKKHSPKRSQLLNLFVKKQLQNNKSRDKNQENYDNIDDDAHQMNANMLKEKESNLLKLFVKNSLKQVTQEIDQSIAISKNSFGSNSPDDSNQQQKSSSNNGLFKVFVQNVLSTIQDPQGDENVDDGHLLNKIIRQKSQSFDKKQKYLKIQIQNTEQQVTKEIETSVKFLEKQNSNKLNLSIQSLSSNGHQQKNFDKIKVKSDQDLDEQQQYPSKDQLDYSFNLIKQIEKQKPAINSFVSNFAKTFNINQNMGQISSDNMNKNQVYKIKSENQKNIDNQYLHEVQQNNNKIEYSLKYDQQISKQIQDEVQLRVNQMIEKISQKKAIYKDMKTQVQDQDIKSSNQDIQFEINQFNQQLNIHQQFLKQRELTEKQQFEFQKEQQQVDKLNKFHQNMINKLDQMDQELSKPQESNDQFLFKYKKSKYFCKPQSQVNKDKQYDLYDTYIKSFQNLNENNASNINQNDQNILKSQIILNQDNISCEGQQDIINFRVKKIKTLDKYLSKQI